MIEVFIAKPLFGNFCYIRDLYIKKAEKSYQKLKITTPKGELICTPQEWLRTAKKMEKVFLRPDQPMVLWGNHVPVTQEEPNNQLRLINDKKQPVFNNKDNTVVFI